MKSLNTATTTDTTTTVDEVLATLPTPTAYVAVKAVSKATGKTEQGRAGSREYKIEDAKRDHTAGFTYQGGVLPRVPNPAFKVGDKRAAGHEPFLRHRDSAGLSGWDVFQLECLCKEHATEPATIFLTRGAAKKWIGVNIPASDIGPVL